MAKPRITDETAIEAIYAPACAPERWTLALDRIADCFDAEGTALVFQRNERDFAALISPAIAAAGLEYSESWGKDDPRAKAVRQLFQEGHAAVTDRHICTADEIESQSYYTEFLAKHGLGWFMATEVSPDPGLLVALSVQRAKHKGAFTDGELARLVPLGRHAEQALRISVRLMWSEAAHRTLGEALAKLSCGVFLLDSMHRVQFSNSAAAELIGDVFDIVDGQLCTRDALPQSSGSVATSQFVMRRGLPVQPDLLKPYLLKGRKSRTPRLVHIIPYQAATDSAVDNLCNCLHNCAGRRTIRCGIARPGSGAGCPWTDPWRGARRRPRWRRQSAARGSDGTRHQRSHRTNGAQKGFQQDRRVAPVGTGFYAVPIGATGVPSG